MTRDSIPMMQCDGDDGFCCARSDDYYEQLASTVDGIRITATKRSPGWRSAEDEDYCPKHAEETP